MGQSEVLNIIEENEPITTKQIKVKYKEKFGWLGSSSIGSSLTRLLKCHIKRKSLGKEYLYSIKKENN